MNKHDSIQPDHGKRVTCAGRNTPSSLSIALCWVVPPWQVSALGGTWHDPLASLQLALEKMWRKQIISFGMFQEFGFRISISHFFQFKTSMFYTFTGVHPGFLSSLLSRTPTSNPIFFFMKTGEKTRRLKNFPTAIHKIYGGNLTAGAGFWRWCIYSQIKEFGALVFAATMNVRQVVSILVSYVTWHHQFWGRQ